MQVNFKPSHTTHPLLLHRIAVDVFIIGHQLIDGAAGGDLQ